ncbi:MAG: hypothetical protein QNJ55_11890 [Xenococcus sp. MO_188.B8]|nr:hypothetical protein [Xenococcus sp. MO_188.B8]
MVKIVNHSNLIRGLLLSTLIWTLPINFELETVAQVESIQSFNFTKEEINRSFDQNRTFDAITLYKFALVSTNKARDLELRIADLEKHIYIESRYLQQQNSFTLNPIDANSERNKFLSLKALLVLFVLSGCTFFIIYKAYKQNNSVKQIKIKDNQINQNYYQKNTVKPSQPYRQRNNYSSTAIRNQRTSSEKKSTYYSTKFEMMDRGKAGGAGEASGAGEDNYQDSSLKTKLADYYQYKSPNRRGITNYSASSQDLSNKNSSSKLNRSRYYHQHLTKQALNLNENSATNLFPTRTAKQSSSKSVTHISDKPNTLGEEIVAIYHRNPRELSIKVIKVAATSESIEQRRAGMKTPIRFTETSNYSYWIIQEPKTDNNYFLVPKPNLVINSHIYQTIEDIFSCQGYQNRASNKFKLKLSAVVQSEGEGSWKLIEPGELIFS